MTVPLPEAQVAQPLDEPADLCVHRRIEPSYQSFEYRR